MSRRASNFFLIMAAFIWGLAFVAQSVGMDYVEPFTFNGIRSIIGFLVLLPVIFFLDKKKGHDTLAEFKDKNLIVGGLLCGVFLAVASSLQQIGIVYTEPGKAGFITALYVIFVPFFGCFLGKRPGLQLWISAVLAVIGMYLLCCTEGLSLQLGDLLILICAVIFAFQVLAVDKYAPLVDGVKLSAFQFLVSGVLNLIAMAIFETPAMPNILACYLPILYAGVLSCGVAYTFQIIGQNGADPATASLLLSLESVFAVLGSWVILGSKLTLRELFGCVIVFGAIILAQLPLKIWKK